MSLLGGCEGCSMEKALKPVQAMIVEAEGCIESQVLSGLCLGITSLVSQFNQGPSGINTVLTCKHSTPP